MTESAHGLAISSTKMTFKYYLMHAAPISPDPVIRMECAEYKKLLGSRAESHYLRELDGSTLVRNRDKAERIRELSVSLRSAFYDHTNKAEPKHHDCEELGWNTGCWKKSVHYVLGHFD